MKSTHRTTIAFPRKRLLLAAGLAALALAGCKGREPGQQAQSAAATVRAAVATVGLSRIPVASVNPGTVISAHQVQVASRLMGYIRELNVQEGEAVKAGQLLFTIDPTDIRGQMNQARAGLAQAEAALADAQADYERFSALYKDESIPKQQFDKVTLQYRVAQSQVAAARAGLATATAQLRYAEVRAPLDGVVLQKMAAAGDLAAPGRPVLVLEDPRRLQVQTTVSGETFARIKPGDTVPVSLDGQPQPVEARVARIVPAADPVTHTYTVKLDLPPLAGLRSGTFARVSFPLGSRDALRVPKSAVLQRAGITGVFVVDGQGVARYRMVRTGAEADGQVEIQAGLNPGERVVISSEGELRSGDKVQAEGASHG